MKRTLSALTIMILLAFPAIAQDVTFPRQLTKEGAVLTMYQPQVDSWEKYKKLEYRMAFSVQPVAAKEALGVLYMTANTETDMEKHTVLMKDFKIIKANFPSLQDEDAKKMEAVVRSFYDAGRTLLMSVEQVVACTPKKRFRQNSGCCE